MTISKSSRTARALGTAVIVAVGVAATGSAQGHSPSHRMLQQHPHKADTTGMMSGSHHLLAMGYRDNLMTFARLLQTEVTRSKSVNLDLARPAVAEMRRSFDKLRQHHEDQSRMHRDSKTPMPTMRDEMTAHLKSLGDLVSGLELELRANPLSPDQVLEKIDAVLEHCEGMMK